MLLFVMQEYLFMRIICIPSGIEGLNPVELVRNMLHTAMEKGNDVKEEIQNILAITLARAARCV